MILLGALEMTLRSNLCCLFPQALELPVRIRCLSPQALELPVWIHFLSYQALKLPVLPNSALES